MSISRPGFSRPGRIAWIVAIGLTWLVTAVVVAWGTHGLRGRIRDQIIGRDAEILLTMARIRSPGEESGEPLEDDPFAVLVSIARLDTILAAWLFDADGRSVASVPVAVREAEIPPEASRKLLQREPFSRYVPALSLTNVFLSTELLELPPEATVTPALEVYIPLGRAGGGSPKAAAGFLIEAGSVAQEFARLDQRLLAQSALLLAGAMTITGLALAWAFRRLEQANCLLGHRTEDLLRANRELSQSARIAALGAVTAHLVHGLRNPVSGLQLFVAARPDNGTQDDEAWGEARDATQRMHALIQQVVAVIREQTSELAYELSLREACNLVMERMRPRAEASGLRLRVEGDPPHRLDNRETGLLALLLQNLVENAIEATPRCGSVVLRAFMESGRAVCEVLDEGGGVPIDARERLFQPQRSTKDGGGGLGLAIARQLGLALGAELSLASTGDSGSTFRIELPPAPPARRGSRAGVPVSVTHHD